jgi:nucleoside permease NupC
MCFPPIVLRWEEGKKLYDAKLISMQDAAKFLHYKTLIQQGNSHVYHITGLSKKALAIGSFALCGFANFSSVGIQIGGIGELAPERRGDLAKLGVKALVCGTLASYLSACIAGILM